jgi:hypothetical protein
MLARDLDLELDHVDIDRLLDVARDAAFSVTRPAAPLATFMVGYAAALRGGDDAAVAHASTIATDAARRWSEDMPG